MSAGEDHGIQYVAVIISYKSGKNSGISIKNWKQNVINSVPTACLPPVRFKYT